MYTFQVGTTLNEKRHRTQFCANFISSHDELEYCDYLACKMLDYLSIAFFTFSRVLSRVFVISEQINLPCIK